MSFRNIPLVAEWEMSWREPEGRGGGQGEGRRGLDYMGQGETLRD